MNGRIVIFTDEPGWHGKRLKRAFAARGYRAVYLPLAACRVDLERGIGGLVLPGFEERLPDGAFVSCTRCRPWACPSTTRRAPSRRAWTRR